MKRTAKHLAFLALSLTGLTAGAQTFTWGGATPSLNEQGSPSTHVLSSKFYRIYSRYNSDLFNQDVNVMSFSADKLTPGSTTDLSVGQPAMGKAMLTHLKMFAVNGATQVIFLDEYNNKIKKRQLFTQTVDLETGKKTDPMLVTEMPDRSSDYKIMQSNNRQFYAVTKYHSFEKKLNEKINIVLLDKDFKVVKETTFETPYINKNPQGQDFYVSDAGTVFIVKNIDLAKQKPFKTIFFWDGKSDTMKETSLKFDNDYQIHQYNGLFNGPDFYFDALYTRIGTKAVQAYGGNKPAAGFYMAKFNAQGDNVYKTANDTDEIAGLTLKEFVINYDKTWLFADKMFVADKNKIIDGKPSFEKDYTYHNEAFLFARLDNGTGKLDWFKEVSNPEEKTLNDNGSFLSFLYFIKDDGLVVLYGDTQTVKFSKAEGKDRVVIYQTYDGTGKQTASRALSGNGLELKYNDSYRSFEENFDLDTSVKPVKVDSNTYIIRAHSNGNEKYGYFKL